MSNDKTGTNKMWGGRFEEAPDDIMIQINASIDVDKRLYLQDIAGSKAHSEMLEKAGILTADEVKSIHKGLDQIQEEIESGKFQFKTELEDIHMNIEFRLQELIGDTARRLHTARSRNDQVAVDFRLWMKQATQSTINEIDAFQKVLAKQIADHDDTIMPGFTHLQIAQPVTLSMHLGAWHSMLNRDKGRFADALNRMDESPLGAGALAGSSYDVDRDMTAKTLGFRQPVENTMDAVASRDFLLEYLAAASICANHLSRFAEELVLWSTTQFNYARLADKFTTGSSIMPQKKNPDAAELVRAKSGRVTGNLVQQLMVMKALPLTYNKDMQEDKAAAFETYDTLVLSLKAMTGMMTDIKFNKDVMLKDTENGFSTATDLADWLVKKLRMPFRDAHHVTGTLVKMAETKRVKLDQLKLEEMQSVEPRITDDIYSALRVQDAVAARRKNMKKFGSKKP